MRPTDQPSIPYYEAFVQLYGLLARDPHPSTSLLVAEAALLGYDVRALCDQLHADAEVDRLYAEQFERELDQWLL